MGQCLKDTVLLKFNIMSIENAVCGQSRILKLFNTGDFNLELQYSGFQYTDNYKCSYKQVWS